jgi:HNH endonuclease/AP2 domain
MIAIKLNNDHVTVVDDNDYEWLNQWKWYAWKHRHTFYARRNGRVGEPSIVAMHIAILSPSDGLEVDHINGNGLDNRRVNLREATHAQNLWNRGRTCNNTSGFKGVRWDKARGAWRATITAEGREMFLGRFDDILDAARAYDEAATLHHGEFAWKNLS